MEHLCRKKICISMHRGNACPIKSQIIPVAITVGIRLSPEEQVRVIASLYRRMVLHVCLCFRICGGVCCLWWYPQIDHTSYEKFEKFEIHSRHFFQKYLMDCTRWIRQLFSSIFIKKIIIERILCYCNNLLFNRESFT